MEESRKLLVGVAIAVAIVVGLSAFSWTGREVEGEKNKDYKKFLQNIDKSITSARFGKDPSSSLKSAQTNYKNLVKNEDFENDSPLFTQDNEIKSSFNTLIGQKENLELSEVKTLREKVVEMGTKIGADLPITYDFSTFFILGIAISLAFLSSVACKMLIDWERLEDEKKTVEKWEEKIREAKSKKGKKTQKLELENDKAKNAKRKVWGISIKQAVFYIAPFVLLLPVLKFVYGDWIVAQLPFDWFTSGAFQMIGVSFKYIGWYIFSFFGFAYIWRNLLLREEK